MNKYGRLSIIMVGICIAISFFVNENNKHPGIFLFVFSILSITGIIFAILSKKWSNIIIGAVLNSATLVFFFFLLLSMGIGEA
ncbi:hypothetical protein [Neobacillus vireti]|uniref:Uncharacterized protein n=1 Tax=Neobacillus vireti LMG 21834 TaxID=1131730 RepID=A0AB94IRJ3_9BACI|nr:hypothetical protein [Neobacillus vireti]ETI69568.1 hypothetical protein BAVI_06609 [Neobacillus vireti LMG 21834]KLT15971.1 hypothetical protein AA980_22555 [Neobacillus vireti]